jgi:protein-S-isoprenylcysteine O-methyltransferase Ste14
MKIDQENKVMEKMSRFGVGPIWGLISISYYVLTILLHRYNKELFSMDWIPYWIIASIGLTLIIIGLPLYVTGRMAVIRAYNDSRLCTQGAFGLCRNPIYAAFAVFFLPGISLLINSWISLTALPVMYIFLRIMIRKEENYLENKFGEEYLKYKKRVPAVFPFGWLWAR